MNTGFNRNLIATAADLPTIYGIDFTPPSLQPKSMLELDQSLTMEAYEHNGYSVCSVCFASGATLTSMADEDASAVNSNPLIFCEMSNVCLHPYCYDLASTPYEDE